MPSITPSLWFGFNRTTDAGPGESGTVLSGSFVLDGTRFLAITE